MWWSISLTVVLSLLVGGLPGEAATRLGLFHTQEELWCWRQRAALDAQGSHGLTCPVKYRVEDDVSTDSPGDWDRIERNTNTFAANPTTEQWDGSDLTKLGNGCIDPNQTGKKPGTNPGLGQFARDAAFKMLLHPEDSRAATLTAQLRTFLLTSVNAPNLQYGTPSLWCPGQTSGDLVFRMSEWLQRIVMLYDYLRSYDAQQPGATLSAGEHTTVLNWFRAAGILYEDLWKGKENLNFVNAVGGNFTLTGTANSNCTQNPTAATITVYAGGPQASKFHESWNNRQAHDITLVGLIGVMTNEATLIATAKRGVQETITYGTIADGTFWEFFRNNTATNPSQGLWYAGNQVAATVWIADALARTGDMSLYTWSTTLTVNRGTSACVLTNTTTKTIRSVAVTYANYADHTLLRYVEGFVGNPNYIIDSRNYFQPSSSRHSYDLGFLAAVPGNLSWQDAYYKQMYTLQRPGHNAAYFTGDMTAGVYSKWGGAGGFFPGILFQYGQLEGIMNPYSATGSATPSCLVTAPATFPVYDTATTPITTLAGTASDDGTLAAGSVTWANTRGGSGVATGTTSWSIPTAPLLAGVNVFTITVTDAEGQPATCQLQVRYQTAADPTSNLVLDLPLDENTGTLATDVALANDGTLSGTATWVPGYSGSAVLFNEPTDVITVPGHLGAAPAITLRARFKLSTVPATNGDVLSVGDAVGLRVSNTLVLGFFYTGSAWLQTTYAWAGETAWHDLVFTAKAGEQILYLDGIMVAYTTHASGPTYTGPGIDPHTTIGAHAGANPAFAFLGTVDRPRVWTRPLSRVDVLAGLNPPVAPLVTVSSPTLADTYSTSQSVLTTLSGTATDSDGTVSSVAWTCTPACGSGPAIGADTWSVPSLTLPVGVSTITVTATDNAAQSGQDVLTVTYTPPAPPVVTGGGGAYMFTGYLLE